MPAAYVATAGRKKLRPAKKSRGPRGGGTDFWDAKRKRFRGRVIVGRKPDGKPLYAERSARTQGELLKKLAAAQPPGPDVTVGEWAEHWLAGSAARAGTRDDYRTTVKKYIIPTLGHYRLADLTPHLVEHAWKRWARPVGDLGPNTLRKNFGHLAACLEAARRAKIIPDNPARDARKPKAAKVKVDPFTAPELARIMTAPGAGVFALLAGVGCRLGEAIALDVADFDRATGAVSITKTYSRRHGVGPPKSENGVRTVRLPRQALPAVREALGTRKTGPLFPSSTGGRREHSRLRAAFKAFLKALGVRYRYPHQLRHGVATVWVNRGAPIGDVAKHLGDSLAVVIKTYVHALGTDPSDVMETALDEFV